MSKGVLILTLAATWTSGEASLFNVEVTSSTAVSGVQVYAESQYYNDDYGYATYHNSPSLGPILGDVPSGGTLTGVRSTSFTSGGYSVGSSVIGSFAAVGTTAGEGIALTGPSGIVSPTFALMFGASGLTLPTVHQAIATGDAATIAKLYAATTWSSYLGGAYSGYTGYPGGPKPDVGATRTLYRFDANGLGGDVGHFKIAPVPEPATFMALGPAVLALYRRRRTR